MARIRFENVMKRFGSTAVVSGLDVAIEDGEFFTFVGPSGCGKSTVLNMIAGLEPVSEGTIYFDEEPVNELSPAERDVAMVFQSYALYPHMTVYDNVAFPLRMKKEERAKIDSEVRRVAELLGIEELLQRKPKALSGGQRQRVALGRAIVRRPRVFLMDEPLSNLDARLRVEMRAELKKLQQELRITTVYVTHDQAEAMGLSERIAVLHEGKIQQAGTPVEIFMRPANTFVGGFMGSPSMNFVPATVLGQDPPAVDVNGKIIGHPAPARPETTNLIAGIRPEHVVIAPAPSADQADATVVLVEPAGSFNWVDVAWKGTTVKGTASLDAALRTGYAAVIDFDPEKVIFFDAASGRRI